MASRGEEGEAVELHLTGSSGPVHATADDAGLRVDVAGQRFDAPWEELVAGFGRMRLGPRGPLGDGAGDGMLLVARGEHRANPLAVQLPADDPDVKAFVAEVRRRAGDRWVGGGVSYPDLASHVFEPATEPRERAPLPRGLILVAFLIAAVAGWQLFEGGHVESPLVAAGLAVVLTAAIVLVFRLRARR